MAASSPVRVGIIGLGRAGWSMHRPELKRHGGFQIVAGCDRLADRAQRLADEEPGARAYTDYRDLLADPEVDLVTTATRSDTHAEVVCAALESGKHVVAEKPFACSVAEADAILAVDARTPGRLFIRQNRRFDPAFIHINEILATGKLGRVYLVKLFRHNYQRRADWQTIKAFKGGQLNNWGPHIIDHGLQLIDAPIVDVWSNLQRIAAAGDAEDHLKIVLTGANGVVADIEISGGVAIGGPIWQILGTQGALVSDEKTIRMRYHDASVLQPIEADPTDPPVSGGFSNQEEIPWVDEEFPVAPAKPTNFFAEVHRALTEDQPFPVKTAEARAVVWVTEQARQGTGF